MMRITVRCAGTVRQAAIGVLLVALGLVMAVTGRVAADQPAGNEWDGKWVAPKHRKFTLRETEGGPTRPARIDVYRVDQVKGGSLLLTPAEHGKSGWSDASQVVPVEQAVAFFSEAIGKSPRDPHNYALRAMVLLDFGEDLGRALADCEEAIRLDPSYALAFRTRGDARVATKELDKAIADFSEVIRLTPQEPDGYLYRADARVEVRDFDGAIADLSQCIRLDPTDSAVFAARGTVWLLKKQIAKAMEDVDHALHLDPKDIYAYLARANLRRENGEFDQAIADSTEAIKLDPQMWEGYVSRGTALRAKKEYDRAIADFTEAIRLDPDNARPYTSRGAVEAERQQYDKALADLDRALELEPDNHEALGGRAWIQATCSVAKFRDGAQAVAGATKVCELTAWTDPGLLGALAAAYAEFGDFESAVKWEAKSIELETDAEAKVKRRARLELYKDKKPYRDTKP
jgi:tetratricopeptide (TPR) repeat protein